MYLEEKSTFYVVFLCNTIKTVWWSSSFKNNTFFF